MDPLLHTYAKSVQESLAELPRESQLLATRVRESDVLVTNLLSELETSSGCLERSALIDLSARLNEAYESKFERVADLLQLLDQRLAALESCKNAAISTLGDSMGTVKVQEASLEVNLTPAATVDIPVASREMRRRKPARHEVVRNRGVRQVQDLPTSAAMDKPIEFPNESSNMTAPYSPCSPACAVCICKQAPTGEMVECGNAECSVGQYHLSCARLKSRPSGSWFCNGCIRRVQ